ncbi:MAG: ABC transporter permease subunit [Acidimicrobiales bacterium]
MTRTLATLTIRQLLGRRRTVLIGLVMALPILIAVVYRFSDDAGDADAEFAVGLVSALIASLLLPLVAVVLGTAALGSEIEDGTAVFLLTKPVARWRVMAVKMVVASVAVAMLVVPATMATAWIVHGSPTADGLMFGLGLGAAVSAVLYCAVFVALSAITSRALIFGLIYVFLWEAFATNLFGSLRWVSIREYGSGWSDALISITDKDIFDPRLGVTAAVIGALVVLAVAGLLGTRALERFEIGERT